MHRVDPLGIEYRLRRSLHRREYRVPHPNALWHIDGYHKLIRWRMVVHGGVDGYSRVPVFLKVSSNNRSETVLKAFLEAWNHGGENVQVVQFMLEHPERGPGRGSIICGRSVHNQRIERLWRDLFDGCISYFYFLFYSLEDVGLLDPDSDIDLYVLHLIFLPKIQSQLDLFSEAWCNHPLRTAQNQTPYQLWILGMKYAVRNNPFSRVVQGMSNNEVNNYNKYIGACNHCNLYRTSRLNMG